MPAIAPYGFWDSPISPAFIAEGSPKIYNLIIDGNDTYWSEMRPHNRGRYTIVLRRPDGSCSDVTPPDFNARAHVHEYGGGAFTAKNGIVYSCCAADQAIYMIEPGQPPVKLTPGQTKNDQGKWMGVRFAGLQASKWGLFAVGERHHPEGDVENFLVRIDLNTGDYELLTSGYDFYSSIAINEEENKIAWLCWNHPHMPWTTTEVWTADIVDGKLGNATCVAGNEMMEAIIQPQWHRNALYFITDRDHGWWNLHRYVDGQVENICPMEEEVGEPLWIFGRSAYAFLDDTIFFSSTKEGLWHLYALDLATKKRQEIPYDGVFVHQVYKAGSSIRCIVGYADREEEILEIANTPRFPRKVLESRPTLVDKGYISVPKHIAFPSQGHTAYGYYYPPVNKDFQAPSGESPPLVVMIHGGPTGQSNASFQLAKQFWTSRGFAVLDVNYGGSTGYGRPYRELLNRQWGVVDIDDCVAGALYLVEKGWADRNKLFIRGGSAGGYTTLAALAFRDIFRSGASYFGVADLTALAKATHKFERYYNDELLGPYPEQEALWNERSPIHAVDKINVPVILFQGEEDSVVPKEQAIMIYEALKQRGIPVELHLYPGEDHGFRQASTIIDTLTREVAFYQRFIKI